jgi:NhaP-type Na+/H+ and K+/H+ antiporter
VEVTDQLLAKGNTLKELTIPPRTLVIMVRRGEDFFVPTGSSELQLGDQLLVISDIDAQATYQHMIDDAEEETQWREDLRRKTRERFDRLFARMKKKKNNHQ